MASPQSVEPKPLRFKVGDLVLYRYSNGWFEGKVISLQYRDEQWEESKPSAPYQIQGITTGHVVCAQDDSDRLVRRMPPDLTPNPKKVATIEVKDPNSSMYVEMRPEWPDQFKRHVQEYISSKRPKKKISAIPMPKPRKGVDGHIVAQVAQVVMSRRRYQLYGYQDLNEAFDSIVPPEDNIAELEEKAKNHLDKMLHLADALMFGLKGWPRDPNRAFKIYHAAAYGCPEDMVEAVAEADGYPGGLPEAACCVAQSFHNHSMVTAFGNRDEGSSTIAQLVKVARRNAEVMRGMRSLLKWYTRAIRKGHVCPNALRYAEVIVKLPPQQQHLFGNLDALLAAWNYRKVEMELEKEAKLDSPPPKRPDPVPMTIKLLGFKATEVYNSLPTNNRVSSVHLEFRQMPLNNTPIYFFAVNRGSAELIKWWRLPARYQMEPFSMASVEEAWLYVLYELHLGIPAGKQQKRCRPQQITLRNDPLHHKVADYLREKLGKDNLTKVEVVEDDDICRSLTEAGNRSLREVMIMIEKDLAQKVMENYTYDHVVEFTHSKYLNHTLPIEKAMAAVVEIKDRGNEHFGANRFFAARYTYTDGIVLIRGIRNKKEDQYRMLGTMVSNRAACTLEMAEGCHLDTAIPLLKEASLDCGLVLKSPWKKVIPDTIRAKLSYRRDTAAEQAKKLEQSREGKKGKQTSDTDSVLTSKMNNMTVDGREGKVILLGSEIVGMKSVKNNGKDDLCPACLARFRVEAEERYCTVLQCGHAYCLPCVGDIQHKSLRMQNLSCPLCRTSIDNLDHIIEAVKNDNPSLLGSATNLPCETEAQRQKLIGQILLIHRFNLPKSQIELECLKLANLTQRGNRKPIGKIGLELRKAFEEFEGIHDFESEAKKNARERVSTAVLQYQQGVTECPDKQRQFPLFCFELLGRNFGQCKTMYDHVIVPCLPLFDSVMVCIHPHHLKSMMEYVQQQQQYKPITCEEVRGQSMLFQLHWGGSKSNGSKSDVHSVTDAALDVAAENLQKDLADFQPDSFGLGALN